MRLSEFIQTPSDIDGEPSLVSVTEPSAPILHIVVNNARGAKGDRGDTGATPYDVAVEAGFVGSEEEWVQLTIDAATAGPEVQAMVDLVEIRYAAINAAHTTIDAELLTIQGLSTTVSANALAAGLAATAAQASATAAAASKTAADGARDAAIVAKTAAETAQTGAVAAKTASETARDTSVTAKDASVAAKVASETAKTGAETAQTAAAASAATALASKNAAATSETNAATSAGNAAGSATAANTSATNAAASKTGADTAKANADTAAANAETARAAAVTAKNSAETAATASDTAKVAAQTAKTGAETARDASIAAKDLAVTAKTNAETARDAAAASALTAQGYASAFPTGGATGYVLTKLSPANYDTGWAATSVLTDGNKGDVIVAAGGTVWTVPALAGKEPSIAPGTAAQYWRGDKTWQAFNAAALGLGNVDNTSDANKPVSTAQAASIALKAALNGATFTGKVNMPAPTAAGANFNIGYGVSPGANSVNGDVWAQSSGLYFKVNGANFQVVTTGTLNNYELLLAAGTVGQYYRGDKTWQTLDKTAVGLANVDNTTDANKPVSTATQTALNLKANLALVGAANGIAPLDATQKIDISYMPDAVVGAVKYQGTWDASTNTPAIPAAAAGNKGYYYKVATAGATNISGITDWQLGDWIISNGASWDKIDNTDSVSSVNGFSGAIVLTTANITEGSNLYFTTARVLATALTGLSTATGGAPTAADTILSALGKIIKSFFTDHSGQGGAVHADVVAGGASGFMPGADKTKLNGIATGATANSADATLLSRTNHTGTQASNTIVVTTNNRILGRVSGAGGAVEELTPAQISSLAAPVVAGGAQGVMIGTDKSKLDGVAAGATANLSDASLVSRSNHTGTQASSTITSSATARILGRISAGGGAIEELTVAQLASMLQPQIQTVASAATVTPSFANDAVDITAQAVALTLANWSGTASNFWGLVVRIKDNGTARTIAYGTNWMAADGVTRPTTTVVGKTHELGVQYNSTTGKFVVLSVVTY